MSSIINAKYHHYEKIPTAVFDTSKEASTYVAETIADTIKANNASNQNTVLGLATGSTPTQMYDLLVRMHKEEGLDFSNVYTFNLDEYYPMEPGSLHSYVRYMEEYLFNHVNIPKENINIPDGTLDRNDVIEFCTQYEQKIEQLGGLDIQILGIGRTGHIGFNEPGSSENSKTRLIALDSLTILDAASDFFGTENVPRRAITMGVGTILEAKKLLLMAWGEGKAKIIKQAGI